MKKEHPGKQESASDEEQSYTMITFGGLEEIDHTNWNLEEDNTIMKLKKIVELTRDFAII